MTDGYPPRDWVAMIDEALAFVWDQSAGKAPEADRMAVVQQVAIGVAARAIAAQLPINPSLEDMLGVVPECSVQLSQAVQVEVQFRIARSKEPKQ